MPVLSLHNGENKMSYGDIFRDLKKKFQRETGKVYDRNLLRLKGDLRRQSYRGSTGELQNSWRYNREGLHAKIENIDPKATEKIVGSPPKTDVKMKALERWGAVKGITSMKALINIKNSIFKRGTRRWIDKENFLGMNRRGSLPSQNQFTDTAKIIEKQLGDMEIK